MTVAEALPTMTDAEKVKAWDAWLRDYIGTMGAADINGATLSQKHHMGPVRAIAHVIADRQPDLAPWKPEDGEGYWFLTWADEPVEGIWSEREAESRARNFGNVFRTREEAEAHAARLRVFNRVCQMMTILGWTAHTPKGVLRAMRKYFAYDDTPTAGEYDAIREQLEKEGAL